MDIVGSTIQNILGKLKALVDGDYSPLLFHEICQEVSDPFISDNLYTLLSNNSPVGFYAALRTRNDTQAMVENAIEDFDNYTWSLT